jgi:hypothetical protein
MRGQSKSIILISTVQEVIEVIKNAVLTRFAENRAERMSICNGVRAGGTMPILAATFSTYHAEPMPATSETVLPNAAAAIVEIPNAVPMVMSM